MVHVFLASPGDVVDERVRALKTLGDLQYNPLLRGKITVETVAWDKPGAGTPMLASKTPQQSHRGWSAQAVRVRRRYRDLLVPDGDPAACQLR
jgi:hypothetical protein